MSKLRKPIYACAPFHTLYLGPGRKEFHPKKPRPGIEHYITEAGKGCLAQVANPDAVDAGVIGNFMASRFNRQGHLGAFLPAVHPALKYKSCTRVEGACGSGGLAVSTAVIKLLADQADAVLVMGVEVQNTVKAVYGADILAGAGHYSRERKSGHAFFFPNLFSDRAGAAYERYGKEYVRRGMAEWYALAVENARRNPKAQEHHNSNPDLRATGMTDPARQGFLPHLTTYDCSKVTDGASAFIMATEKGLKKLGVDRKDTARVLAVAHAEGDITQDPEDLCRLDTTEAVAAQVFDSAGITVADLGVLELHDCFTITGLIALEAIGAADRGQGAQFVLDGNTRIDGSLPTNVTGGLVGFGHPTGATGVRQCADLVLQLTGKAGDCQVSLQDSKPYGMFINMGGNDKTLVSAILGPAE